MKSSGEPMYFPARRAPSSSSKLIGIAPNFRKSLTTAESPSSKMITASSNVEHARNAATISSLTVTRA